MIPLTYTYRKYAEDDKSTKNPKNMNPLNQMVATKLFAANEKEQRLFF